LVVGQFDCGREKHLPDRQIGLILAWSGNEPEAVVQCMPNAPKRPRDPNQLAKAIVDIATGQAQPDVDTNPSAASQLGRLGGLKGGRARADRLSPEKRQEIARMAAAKRWQKNDGGSSDSE
jgi:hypothetical protein